MQAARIAGLHALSTAPLYNVIGVTVVAGVCVLALLLAPPAHALNHVPLGTVRIAQVQDAIERRVASEAEREAGDAERAYLDATAAFYGQRKYLPAWLDNLHVLHVSQLGALAEMHGLNPADYDAPALAAAISARMNERNVDELARLDMLASQRIAMLAVHLSHGKLDPSGKRVRLQAPPSADVIAGMLHAAARGESLLANLDSRAPDTPAYRQLRLALAHHRESKAAGMHWPRIAAGTTLGEGMRDPRVPALRERLHISGSDPELYDADVTAAVAAFQAQHQLQPDGMLGPATRRALNMSLTQRIDQLRVNLDRQRWLAQQAERDYLYINIPTFTLHKIENGERVASMRTQVGKRKRQTPVLKSTVDAIMANPSWTVPPTVFREDILPELQNDPGYLRAQGMRVVDSRGRTVDSADIDWQQLSGDDFPYRLRARPGDSNALGRMKFLIPNPYLIYLHDTPAQHLFGADNRAVSSGCIRVAEPDTLAEWLVAQQSKISDERLQAALAATGTRYLGFDQPVPVLIAYVTVELATDGRLAYAPDVYGRDAKALAVLDSLPHRDHRLLLADAR